MKNEQVFFTNGPIDDLANLLAEKVAAILNEASKQHVAPPPNSPSEDILFKSLQEAADYYGVCYQTISKELEKIDHMPLGNSIKIYKSAIERAITIHGIIPKKGVNK